MGKTIENYTLLELIGEGSFAKVFKARHLISQKEFAVKVISSEKLKDMPKLEEGAVNEISILSKLRNECEYIIGYVDMLKTVNNFYFVYEYCNGGSLDRLIQK
jgi:serine/threonine-protein kinase ULK/ATG1